MRIRIKTDECNLRLWIPTGLIFNRFTAGIAVHTLRKYTPGQWQHLTPEQMNALFYELRRIKDRYGSWEMVDVQSGDGEKVKVIL